MKRKIMVIDDDVDISHLLKHNLENKGKYEVVVENKSTSAARRAWEVMPDLIVLDVVMPDKDGGDVQTEIRQNNRTKNIPIIFLTSLVRREESSTSGAMIAGDKFLAKPVQMGELIAEIEACLNYA